MKKTISVRQLSLIGFVSSFALKLTILPSLFYEKSGVDAIFSLAFIMLIDFIEFLIIYYLLKKNQNVGFYQFLCKGAGKFFSKVILLVLLLFFFFKMMLLLRGGFDYARLAIFKEAPFYLYAFILLAISTSLVLFKSRSYARTVEFFYPIIAVMFIGFIAIALLTAPLQDLRPLLTQGPQNIFGTAFSFGIVGGNYLFMLFFMGKVKFGQKNAKTLVGHILFGILILMTFYTINYSIFKYTATAHPHAISEIIQFLPIPSVLGNFSWFAVSIMLLLFVLIGGLYMMCLSYCGTKIMVFKKERPILLKISLLIINVLLVSLAYFVFDSFSELRAFSFDSLYVPILSVITFAVPLVVLILHFVVLNKQKQQKKGKEPIKLGKLVFKGEAYEKDF